MIQREVGDHACAEGMANANDGSDDIPSKMVDHMEEVP